MKKRKTIFIALGSVALIFALLVGSYVIRQNQYQEMLAVSAMMDNEDIDGATADNEIADYAVADEIENGSALSAEPSAKLDKMYEEAMENSNLEPYEIELIRSMVEKENKTFEQALQAVRPGSKVIQEQTDTQTTNNNQKPQQPPTKPSGNDAVSANYNDSQYNGNNKTEQEKKLERDFFNKNSGDAGGQSEDVSHEPDFGLPDNRTDAQKKADEDAANAFNGGLVGGPGGDVSHEPDF